MSHEVNDMLVVNRKTEIPVMPQTAARAAGDLAKLLSRLQADAGAVEAYFGRQGEPFEGLAPSQFLDILANLRAINPPPETATIVSLVWMLTDAVLGLIRQLEAVKEGARS